MQRPRSQQTSVSNHDDVGSYVEVLSRGGHLDRALDINTRVGTTHGRGINCKRLLRRKEALHVQALGAEAPCAREMYRAVHVHVAGRYPRRLPRKLQRPAIRNVNCSIRSWQVPIHNHHLAVGHGKCCHCCLWEEHAQT